MPFDITDLCTWANSSKDAQNILLNPFYTSILLASIIVLIILWLYPCKKDTPAYILLQVGLYILLSSFGVLFLHNSLVCKKMRDDTAKQANYEFIDGSGKDPIYDAMPVIPATGASEYVIETTDADNDDFLEKF